MVKEWLEEKLLHLHGNSFELISSYQDYNGINKTEKYVLRGTILKCNKGSSYSVLDMSSDHGVEPAVALMSDCNTSSNIYNFGTCECCIDSCNKQCKPILNNMWLQNGNKILKIWNENTQQYEDVIKDSAVLPCYNGGIISVVEVPIITSNTIKLLLCNSLKRFKQRLTSGGSVPEAVTIATIEDNEIPKGSMGDYSFSTYSSNVSVNDVLETVMEYVEAGGDFYGVFIALQWLLALTKDAPDEITNYLREIGEIDNDEKVGELILDPNDITWVSLYKYTLFSVGLGALALADLNWPKYMRDNKVLAGKVGDVIIPMGDSVKEGETRLIKDMSFSMIIENGGGFTGYEFLHGTNGHVGHFQVNGYIQRNSEGVTYTIAYTWNDIIDPNFIYSDDIARNDVANFIGDPKAYVIRIKWHDVTTIKTKRGGVTKSGWLKNWSKDWVKDAPEEVRKTYYDIDYEQVYNEKIKGLAWSDVLNNIKEEYKEYYN